MKKLLALQFLRTFVSVLQYPESYASTGLVFLNTLKAKAIHNVCWLSSLLRTSVLPSFPLHSYIVPVNSTLPCSQELYDKPVSKYFTHEGKDSFIIKSGLNYTFLSGYSASEMPDGFISTLSCISSHDTCQEKVWDTSSHVSWSSLLILRKLLQM